MKTFLKYFGIALLFSAIGMFLIDLGGWSETGPKSNIAFVGGLLNQYHLLFWTMIFGNFATNRPIIDFFIVLLIPTAHWMMLLFVAKTVWTQLWSKVPAVNVSVGSGGKKKKGKK